MTSLVRVVFTAQPCCKQTLLSLANFSKLLFVEEDIHVANVYTVIVYDKLEECYSVSSFDSRWDGFDKFREEHVAS